MNAVGRARNRWQEIIVQHGNFSRDFRNSFPMEYVATALPPLVSDLYVAVKSVNLNSVSTDPEFQVLGRALVGLVRVRGVRAIPITGYVEVDRTYVNTADEEALYRLFLHELGHILGFGTLFEENGLHDGTDTSDRYTGVNAQAEWEKLCPGGRIPIETDFSARSAGSHWDEACLVAELMTSRDRSMPAKLSQLTVAAFKDLGFGVNMAAADTYTVADLGDCQSYCPSLLRRNLGHTPRVDPSTTKVSAAGHETVLVTAAQLFKASSSRASVPSSDFTEGIITNPAEKSIVVFVRDYDGIIKEDTVTFEDVRHLL